MLSIDTRKGKIEIKKFSFRKDGVMMFLGSGETDLYTYSWLAKHHVEIE
jgi:hypothetical protein